MAAETAVRAAGGFNQPVRVEVSGDQVRDDLDVGFGGELRAVRYKLLLELHVVLDDPVDHDVDAVLRVVVRMRVLLGDPAVGCPAGVTDARGRGRGGDSDRTAGVG